MPHSKRKSDSDFQVVVLDDAHGLGPMIDNILSGMGCRVYRPTLNGLPWKARELKPNLIILDLSLYGAGSPSSHYLRRLAGDAPVIVVSADATLEFDYPDAFDFLLKPLDIVRLRENIAYLRDNRRRSDAEPFPPLNAADFALFQEFLHTHSGLHFDERNSKLLEQGVFRRMRAVAAPDYAAYYAYLLARLESHHELKRLLSVLTVGETYFFRYATHFDALAELILPELIERNRRTRMLRFWSAGCSTGEEPYSLAMLLLDRFPQLAGWDVSILATDINKRSLAQARTALYGGRTLRHVEPALLERWFAPEGDGRYRVDKRVRSMVKFAYLNLQTGRYPIPDNGTAGQDVIFCRNVMIYFKLATVRAVVEGFRRALKPGGYFFLGHAETLLNISDAFRRRQYKGGFLYYLPEVGGGDLAWPRSVGPLLPPSPPVTVKHQTTLSEFVETQPTTFPPDKRDDAVSIKDIPLLLSGAEQAFQRENYRTAYQKYDMILNVEPHHVGALLGRGFILAGEGAYDEALALCDRVLQLDDLCAEAYFLRGLIHDHHDEIAAAVDAYRKALLLDISFVMPHYHLGQLFRRTGRDVDAGRQLRNVVRLLEKTPADRIVPYSGGLSAGALLERCNIRPGRKRPADKESGK